MTNPDQLESLIGSAVVSPEGEKIGKVGQVYVSDDTGQPEWVTVHTGLFGTKESFAPLYNARLSGDQLVLAVSKQLVKDAPQPDLSAGGHLPGNEVDALYQHYAGHLAAGPQAAAGSQNPEPYQPGPEDDPGRDASGRDASGPASDDAMTRSEERLNVGTRSAEVGRARLRKYVVTEQVTTTVPVSHEEVRVEREPITGANRDTAMSGRDITEDEHEVVLHAEQPVVQKEAVPVERVRLGTETVTEQQEVTEQVRKEQIDAPDVDRAAGTSADRGPDSSR